MECSGSDHPVINFTIHNTLVQYMEIKILKIIQQSSTTDNT
jgi:hypothetical protein